MKVTLSDAARKVRTIVKGVSAVGIGHNAKDLVLVLDSGGMETVPGANWTSCVISKSRKERKA